ncbi:PQQ-binding-like beta-propeller repeat protein [Candidatus Aenigmatarchaeota archaeon]
MDGYKSDISDESEKGLNEKEEKYYAIKRKEDPKQETKEPGFDDIWDIEVSGSIGSSAFLYNDTIYFGGCDQYVYALDLDGKMKWQYRTGGVVISSPTIVDDKLFVASFDGFIYCLSADNGKLLWKYKTGNKIVDSPVIVGDRIYIGGGDNFFYSLSFDGDLLWKFEADGPFDTTAAVANDMIFIGSKDKNMYCLSDDGSLQWKFPAFNHIFTSPILVDKNSISSFRQRCHKKSPTVKDGSVLFGSLDKNIYSVSLDGKLLWKKMFDGAPLSAPFASNGSVYFGSLDRHLYALTLNGDFRWKFESGGPIISSPFIHNNVVYFGSFDKNFYAVSTEGETLWKFNTGGIVGSSPIIHKNMIIFGSMDTFLYALDMDTRDVLWTFQTGQGFQSNVKRNINVITEFDKKIFKVWKPETRGASGSVDASQRGYKGKVDVPEGLTYGGERTYSSSNPAYTGGGSYHSKRDKKKNKFGPKWMDM